MKHQVARPNILYTKAGQQKTSATNVYGSDLFEYPASRRMAASEDDKLFEYIAPPLDKRLVCRTSQTFKDSGYATYKIPNELNVLMAEASNHFVE